MKTSEVVSLLPGAIIELPKSAEEELTLLVNDRPIGSGLAVKVGENFGLRITFIGDVKSRIKALGKHEAPAQEPPPATEEHDIEPVAAAAGAKG